MEDFIRFTCIRTVDLVLQPTLGLHSRVVMHDIPVNVVPRRLWEEYQEPVLPQFDVSIRPKKKYVCVSDSHEALTLSLPYATVVELTVHCQTRLWSKFKGTYDSCLFLTVIRDANLCSLFCKCLGDILISYMEVNSIFCTRIDLTRIFVMSLDFPDQKQRKHVQGNDIQDALSPSTAIICIISDETIYMYQNKSVCLILGVDVCFIFFFA